MTVYILNIVLIIAEAVLFLDMYRDKLSKKIYFTIVTISLSLVAGLRDVSIGIDTKNYEILFKNASHMKLSYILKNPMDLEKGYMIFQNTISRFSTNYNVFLLVVSIIFMTSIAIFIYKNSSESSLSFI